MRPIRTRELAAACALALTFAACSRSDSTKLEDTTQTASTSADGTNTDPASGASSVTGANVDGAPPSAAPTGAGAPAATSASAATSAVSSAHAPPLPAKVRAQIDTALDAYEILREKLAADTTDGVGEAARTLAGAAREAAAGSQGAARGRLTSLASTADALKNDAGSDIAKARDGFSEVSRNVVALLSHEPSLTQGRYVFECPMTNGYQKWVQTASAITNPYMGSRMLECGAASEWKE